MAISARKSHNPAPRATGPVILYAGRLEPGKGILVLLEAARTVLAARPDALFVLAGAPQPDLPNSELQAHLRRLNLIWNFRVLGHLAPAELADWYRRATVGVLPSYYESFGVAALEAMAHGLPVVATTAGGLPEVVRDGETGLLVPPGASEPLAAAILRLLEDEALRERMGRAGCARAADFAVEHTISRNVELYNAAARRIAAAPANAEHVFFSPHFDDAVLSCGGLIARLCGQGRAVRVVNVFAAPPAAASYSAFARHLHATWGISRIAATRRREDLAALSALGVTRREDWDFCEAPYRQSATGSHLYASYEQLCGTPALEDTRLVDQLAARIEQSAEQADRSLLLYFPLALGGHVDHQILYRAGLRLCALGWPVHFYEDWPYADAYRPARGKLPWLSETIASAPAPKIRAARRYRSQLVLMGGSAKAASERIKRSMRRIGGERYWTLDAFSARQASPTAPFARVEQPPRLRDLRKFAATLRWHDLDEMLPVGNGVCLDGGCGDARHRPLIERRGYRWVGLDRESRMAGVQADCTQLPLADSSAAALVLWQVLEYVGQPEAAVAEAARVLQQGGSFCGSVSYLEPTHGPTLFNISPLLLREMLERHGFKDITIRPGLGGFSLMLWTWLRRLAGPRAGRFALPLVAAALLPLAVPRFLASWLKLRFGRGNSHGMSWIADHAPLEFAGHVLFSARKAANTATPVAPMLPAAATPAAIPPSRDTWKPGDFRRFTASLRWHDLDEYLRPGSGICLDVGSGAAPHRRLIQQRGYRWIGLDYYPEPGAPLDVQADAQQLPVASSSVACLVHWGVLSMLADPRAALAESHRVLQPGGALYGYAPFLEPKHGENRYACSPLALERLLTACGFVDVRLLPGLGGFSLSLWTWLRRWGGERAGRLALPLARLALTPPALARFALSYLNWRAGRGSAHGMEWLVERSPLEFAGHVIFTARKAE